MISITPKTAPANRRAVRYDGPFRFYVDAAAPAGGDGSEQHPFATMEAAKEAVRQLLTDATVTGGIAVCVRRGEYLTRGLSFGKADGGRADCPVTWYAEPGVVLNAGFPLPADRFVPAEGAIAARMPEGGKHVKMLDLRALGLTKQDWGEMHPFSGTANMYDSFRPGVDAALYVNGRRMITARYPNQGEFLHIENVYDQGEVAEFPPLNYFTDFHKLRNPRPGTIVVDKPTCDHMKTWASTENLWIFGYFYHDWYENSSPVERVNLDNRLVTPAYSSHFGYRPGARYYFYNIPEELDQPGEWYLDREAGVIYLYPPQSLEGSDIILAVSEQTIFCGRGAEYLTFDGFTLKGTLGNAVQMEGNHLTICNSLITAVSGNAISLSGSDNLVRDCEISHTGRGGVILSGGDRKTLTSGRNRAEYNLVHDWSEIWQTCQPAFLLQGVGAVCAHNEMYNSPHSAIMYSGNDHLIEYNLIHDVVLLSTDAAAIYSGHDWLAGGTVLRYNVLYRIGQEPNNPDGIYFDDALNGQTAYGNLLIGVRKYGFLIGGGRMHHVTKNIIIGCDVSIFYDDRARDGFLHDGWYRAAIQHPGQGMWENLRNPFFRSGIWAERFPLLAKISEDFSQPDDIDFGANPSYSVVEDNLLVTPTGKVGDIAESVFRYSRVEHNLVYTALEEVGFTDPEAGDFTLRADSPVYREIPDFANIPLDRVGRVE